MLILGRVNDKVVVFIAVVDFRALVAVDFRALVRPEAWIE